MMRRTFAVVASTLLASCASGPAFQRMSEPPVPAQYRNAGVEDNNVPRRWWLLFGDDKLTELVEVTLRNNPYSNVGPMKSVQARAQVQAAGADGMPQLKAEAAAKNSRSSTTTPLGKLLGGRPIAGNELSAGIGAGWQIDLWQRVAKAVEAAEARVGMAETVTRQVELVLSMEVAVTYWQYRAADADLRLLEGIRDQRSESVRLQERRVEADLGDEMALARARVDLGKAESDILESRRKRTLMEQELATLAVVPLKDFAMAAEPSYRMPAVPAVAPGLPTVILSRRPDLTESTYRIRELLAQEAIAEAAFYPTIGLTGNFGYASEQLKDFLKWDSRQFSVGPLAFSVPIFDGGRNRANLEAARAAYREASDLHYSKLLIALREVDDALFEIRTSREQVEARSGTLRSARRLVALARSRFEEGAASYVDVTAAESGALEAERELTRSQAEGLLATVRLVVALGGGWPGASFEGAHAKGR